MNALKTYLLYALLVVLVFSCDKRLCGCTPPPSALIGEWKLSRITYGLTQKTVTATEAGYSETLLFNGSEKGGTYRLTRNGLLVNSGDYSLSFPNSGSTEGLVYFLNDTTQQSFRLIDKILILSERGPRGATIADGSTYEYQRR
ncbi:MAG TPA: hypothetical protein VK404_11810 [Spirosoma sp.]|jgi:hypothetical protein|nr:hypothetical protein [Spirosoma sp.]